MQINTISVFLYAHIQSITVLDLLVHYFINIYIHLMWKFSLQTEYYLLHSCTGTHFTISKNMLFYNTWYLVNNTHLDILKYLSVTNMLLHAAYQYSICCL